MKMQALRSLIFVMMLHAAPAAGQASISVGPVLPIGPEHINDAYSTGLGLWGAFGVSRAYIATPRVVAGFSVIQTDREFLREVSEQLGVDVEGGDLSTIVAGFDVLFVAPFAAVRPYIAPGVGYAILTVDDFTVGNVPFQNVESEQAFAALLTAGAAVQLGSGPHLLLEARLIHAFTENDRITWLPINVGIIFDLN